AAGGQGSSSSPRPAGAQNASNGGASSEDSCVVVVEPPAENSSLSTIKQAQAAFQCPAGYKLYSIRSCDTSRSPMYSSGVRVVSTDAVASRKPVIKGLFFCMASSKCREQGVKIKISNKNTTPATTHLSEVHGIISKRGQDLADPRKRSEVAID
ncbi:unnamed protein product, partial [Scytosiphon promiscuus]